MLAILALILGIFGLSLLTKDNKEKLQKAKDHIKKAGKNIAKLKDGKEKAEAKLEQVNIELEKAYQQK